MGMVVNPFRLAAASSGGHRYWQINIRKNGGAGSGTIVQEVEMRTSPGGADVTGSGTPYASSGTAANAFDNNTGTSCAMSTSNPQTITYDFGVGQAPDVVEVGIASDSGSGENPNEIDIKYSDDAITYTTAWRISKPTGWTSGVINSFTKPSAANSRYWRVFPLTLQSGTTVLYAAEIEMRASLGGADQCSGGNGIRRTQFSTFGPNNAFDNNAGTVYLSNDNFNPSWPAEWIGYDFGAGNDKAVVQVSYTTESGGSFTNAPASGTIESSPDGICYLPRISFSGLTWTSGSTNLIS